MTQPSQFTADRLAAIRRAKNRATRIVWIAGALAVWLLAVFLFAKYFAKLTRWYSGESWYLRPSAFGC